MSVSLIIFIIIHIAVLTYFVESLRRISHRVREYPLEDNSETLPFAFVRLRYIIILYIIIYILWIIFSIWLYAAFLGSEPILTPKTPSKNNVILDL